MNVTISDAFDAEVFAAVARVWAATGVGNPARGDSLESVQATLARGGKLFTVRAGEEVAGVCWLTDDGRRLYLHHMAVDTRHQGKGHSRLLMDAALAYARECRLQMKLEVHKDNERARRLYLACGFVPLTGYEPFIRRAWEE